MKSKLLAISAISAGFIALFLTLGAYVQVVDLFVIVVASVFVILPLYYKSYTASFLAYLAGGVLAFLFSGFNFLSIVFPAYFGFFGIYPIIRHLMKEKRVNKIVTYIVGGIWCVLAVYGIFFFYTLVMKEGFVDLPQWIVDNIYWLVGVLAVVFYFVYDYSILIARRAINKYLRKIIK